MLEPSELPPLPQLRMLSNREKEMLRMVMMTTVAIWLVMMMDDG